MIETAINLDNKSINDSTDKSNDAKQTNDDNQPTLILKNQIHTGQLFGPFSDPIQWLAIRHSPCKTNLPKEISTNLDNDLFNLFASIQMANSSDEQNMEIIVNKNKFYFRAMQEIELADVDDKNSEIKKDDKEQPLFAWFSSELSGKLPTPGVSLINGNKRYFCTKCNQVFIYPNSAILHILFACAKQSNSSSTTTTNSTTNSSNTSNGNVISANCNVQSTSPNNNSFSDNSSNFSNNLEFINKLTASTIASSLDSQDASNNTASTNTLSPNNEISLSNSKILKNLEAKLCKQFNANISPSDQVQQNSKTKTKKRSAFDIDSLVNSSHSDHGKKAKSKNDKSFKMSTNTPVSTNSANLNNSTLINSLNSPLASANSNYLNPFSFLDPTASLASSAFHKFDNSLMKSSLTDPNSLLNAAAMFNNSNFTNPYDLGTLYAQHQRNLLQSLYLQSAAASNPLLASQNLTNLNLQNSLASSLFGLGSSNLNSFNGLDLFNLPSSTAATVQSSSQSNSHSNLHCNSQSTSQTASQQNEKNQTKKSKKSKEVKSSQQNLLSNNDNQNSLTKLTQQLQSQSTQQIPPSYLQFLPPSLAALSYPQSNWCAKCSIGFRMTSDLVYHMRSQHKESSTSGIGNSTNGQSTSPIKRKREENKLFCTICGEGFRERHHLTRHMISH